MPLGPGRDVSRKGEHKKAVAILWHRVTDRICKESWGVKSVLFEPLYLPG